jgi:uncharacterized integral membrane protein
VDDRYEENTAAGKRRDWKSWLMAIAGILLLIFVAQNSREEEIDFLFASINAPLVFALVFAGLLGALIGWAAPRVRRGGRD